MNNYMSGIMATIMQNGRMQETLEFYRREYEVRLEKNDVHIFNNEFLNSFFHSNA